MQQGSTFYTSYFRSSSPNAKVKELLQPAKVLLHVYWQCHHDDASSGTFLCTIAHAVYVLWLWIWDCHLQQFMKKFTYLLLEQVRVKKFTSRRCRGSSQLDAFFNNSAYSMYSTIRCRKLSGSLNTTGIVILDSSFTSTASGPLAAAAAESLSDHHHSVTTTGWLGGVVVRTSDLWSRDRRFDSWPVHCRVA